MTVLDTVGAAAEPAPDMEYICEDELFSTEYPGLHEFLARIKIGGVVRKPGRLVLYYEPGKAHVCLSDKHTASVAFHSSESIGEALSGAEKRLQDGKLDWRKDKRARY
jgi:hypothetical protein